MEYHAFVFAFLSPLPALSLSLPPARSLARRTLTALPRPLPPSLARSPHPTGNERERSLATGDHTLLFPPPHPLPTASVLPLRLASSTPVLVARARTGRSPVFFSQRPPLPPAPLLSVSRSLSPAELGARGAPTRSPPPPIGSYLVTAGARKHTQAMLGASLCTILVPPPPFTLSPPELNAPKRARARRSRAGSDVAFGLLGWRADSGT